MPLSTRSRWKICAIGLILLTSSGCATLVAKTPPPVLLQENQIYKVEPGQEIVVSINNTPTKIKFPCPMYLMSTEESIRYQKMMNDAMLKGVKAGGERMKWLGIIGSLLGIIAGTIWLVVKKGGILPKISAKVETK